MKKRIETGKLLIPEALVERDPRGRIAQRRRLQAAEPDAAGLAGLDQAGVAEHAQVLGDRRQRHRVRLGQGGDRSLALSQVGEDGAARGVGEGGERAIERRRRILNHMVKY